MRRATRQGVVLTTRHFSTKTTFKAAPQAPPQKTPPPSSSPQSSTTPPPTQKPPKNNAWLLHPALPVDVRLLGAGLGIGIAGWYAWQSNSSSKKPTGPSSPEQYLVDTAPGGEKQEADGQGGPSEEDAGDQDHTAPAAAAAAGDTTHSNDDAHQNTSTKDGTASQSPDDNNNNTNDDDDDNTVTYVDPTPMMNMLQEALGGGASAAATPATPPPEHIVDVITALEQDAHAQPPVHELRSLESMMPQGGGDLQNGGDYLQNGGGGGAETGSDSTAATTGTPGGAAAPAEGGDTPTTTSSSSSTPITAAWLIDQSNAARDAPPTWEEYDVRLKQAEADAATVQALMQQVQAQAAKDVATATHVAQHIQALAKHQEQLFLEQLHKQAEALAMQRAAELQLQADKLALEREAAVTAVHKQYTTQLDAMRTQLNVLATAFARRSEERKSSHSAHKLALAGMALQEALDHGRPCVEEVDVLRAAAGEDPVAAVVLSSVERVAQGGVSTVPELIGRVQRVRRRLGALMLIGEGDVGPMTLAVATVAGWLRVGGGGGGGNDVASVLDQVEALVESNELLRAAAVLEAHVAGTAAAGTVGKGLVGDLRARAAVEMASALLSARARALSASLA